MKQKNFWKLSDWRHTALKAGIVKIVLKSNTFTVYFYQTEDENFIPSPIYNSLLIM